MRVILIGCGSKKKPHACAAKDLYCGQLFQKTRGYAEAQKAPYYILSALYGVLDPMQVIAPYDLTLPDNVVARTAWTSGVVRRLLHATAIGDEIEVLAGQRYLDWIPEIESQGRTVTQPLRGLRMGERIALLSRWCKGSIR